MAGFAWLYPPYGYHGLIGRVEPHVKPAAPPPTTPKLPMPNRYNPRFADGSALGPNTADASHERLRDPRKIPPLL